MAHEPIYLDIARVLLRKLHDLKAGDSDSIDIRQVLEIAAEEFGIEADECVHNRKRKKTSLREDAEVSVGDVGEAQSCLHFCENHKEVMFPGYWGTLPHEILRPIFAHLPLNDIRRLSCLSHDWKKSMVSRDSDFFRPCDEAHPRMFAIIRKILKNGLGFNGRDIENLFLVRVFDTKSNTWHDIKISTENQEAGYGLVPSYRAMLCEDGGLLLFCTSASTGENAAVRSYFFTVMNPLTGRSRDLPPIMNVRADSVTRIHVDREAHCYKVLSVCYRSGGGHDTRVFESETGVWSQPNEAADIRFGNQSAHDFGRGRMKDLGTSPYEQLQSLVKNIESYTYLKDDQLFVLHKDTNDDANDVPTNRPSATFYIREYAVEYHPHHPPKWLEVGIHRCNPFEHIPRSSHYGLRLLASNGFLVAFAYLIHDCEPFDYEQGWIYDLATRIWRNLPKLPGNVEPKGFELTCEIRWSAYP